jgi:hypothetical protein
MLNPRAFLQNAAYIVPPVTNHVSGDIHGSVASTRLRLPPEPQAQAPGLEDDGQRQPRPEILKPSGLFSCCDSRKPDSKPSNAVAAAIHGHSPEPATVARPQAEV